MQTKAWDVHVVKGLRRVQRNQLHSDAIGVCRLNGGFAAQLKIPAQPFAAERYDHWFSVLRDTEHDGVNV